MTLTSDPMSEPFLNTPGRALAIDIGGTKIAAGLVDPDGRLEHGVTEPTDAEEGAESVLERALELARRTQATHAVRGGEIVAVGVSTMGLTHETHVALAPNVPGWHLLQIPSVVGAAFPGLPVVIGNDVHYAARAEMAWGSLCGISEGIYLNLGTGISAAIIAGGNLLEGAHGASGEVGYTLTPERCAAEMAADGSAPFEEWYGGAGVARRVQGSELPTSVSQLCEQSRQDQQARKFLDSLWDAIATLAANLCIAIDPAVLSVGGGYVRTDTDCVDRIRALVDRAVPFPPLVARAEFGADASLRGAGAMALEAIGVLR